MRPSIRCLLPLAWLLLYSGPAALAEPASGEAPSPAEEAEARLFGRRSPITDRRTLRDNQTAAARPGDYTLHPEYRGFIPIPQTVFLIQFNPRPRVDLVGDTGDPGTDFRFVPSLFPADEEDGWRMSANANASQLRVDLQAPTEPGNFRFFYQNDFFGSNTNNMNYRLQHLYGQYYGFLGGFTFGVFEDPDAWPDTVDYEGPNSVIFARRAVLHYTTALAEQWELTVGLEDPDIYVDTTGDPTARVRSRIPDVGFNARWTPGELGHVQASVIFRSIGVDGGIYSDDDVFGWGIDTSGSLNLTKSDSAQFWFVYGRGVGGMGNDTSFLNSDAAYRGFGDLKALRYWSTMIALTHRWTPRWRSTLTHGYVDLENTSFQAADAYRRSHYASVNLIYQLFKRLSIGAECLYGYKEVKDGRQTDLVRLQVGVHYALFD